MKRGHIWVGIAGIVVVVFAALTISIAHTNEIAMKSAEATHDTGTSITVTAVRDSFKKGTHTITGTVLLPTPCYSLSAAASLETDSASLPGRIRVDLTIPPDSGICLELPQTDTFSTTISGASGLLVDVFVNGTLATSTED